MLQLESQFFEPPGLHPLNAAVMVIGGAEDKVHGREILQTFFRRAGGEKARIVVIPSASREPAVNGETYRTIFEEMGAPSIVVMDIRDREQAESCLWLSALEGVTGVFITGGDQLRLCGILADTPLMDKVRFLARMGQVTLAGTSAGAAVMGHHMISGGGSGECPNRCLVDMAVGLGFLPDIIVDQHFHNRNRMARLMSAVSTHPGHLGIGIDEDTCAVFERDSTFHVIGKGTVTIVDPQDMSTLSQSLTEVAPSPLKIHNLRVHILSYGDRYNLEKRQIIQTGNSE
jgi:cyanophycinase